VYGWTRNHLDRGASAYPLRDFLSALSVRKTLLCQVFAVRGHDHKLDRGHGTEVLPDARVNIVPNGVDLALFPYRPEPGGHNLVFVGAMGFYP